MKAQIDNKVQQPVPAFKQLQVAQKVQASPVVKKEEVKKNQTMTTIQKLNMTSTMVKTAEQATWLFS